MDFLTHPTLPGNPVANNHASNKQYVDEQVATRPGFDATVPAAVAGTAAAGSATTTARRDHVHNYSFDATVPAAVAATAAVGTATVPARRDHVHNYSFDATAPAALGATAAVGTATQPARRDHVHPLPSLTDLGAASAGDLTTHTGSTILHLPVVGASDNAKVLTAGAAGAAPTWQPAQSGVTLGTGTTSAVADTASNGTAATAARFDHVHSYGFDATAPAAVAGTAAVGTATVPARRDHVHAYSFDATAPAAVNTTAAVGTATVPARRDHVHAYTLASTAPAALGAAAAVGTATLPARSDHVHIRPSLTEIGLKNYRGTVTGNGALLDLPVTHGLDSQECEVWVWRNTTPPKRVRVDHTHTGVNTLALNFATAPASTDTYIVRVIAIA